MDVVSAQTDSRCLFHLEKSRKSPRRISNPKSIWKRLNEKRKQQGQEED